MNGDDMSHLRIDEADWQRRRHEIRAVHWCLILILAGLVTLAVVA